MVTDLIVVAALVLVVFGATTVRVLKEYERGVAFRLGRLRPLLGPGLAMVIRAWTRRSGSTCVFGAMVDTDTDASLSPVFLYLVIGIVIGGLGVLMAIYGARVLFKHRREEQIAEESDTATSPVPD